MNQNFKRFHRYRTNETLRNMLSETVLRPSDFILPLFVNESLSEAEAVASLPGVFQHTLTSVLNEVEQAQAAGVKSVLLFGIPKEKSTSGNEAFNENGIVQQAIRTIKQRFPEMVVMADCCLCEYTSHGHCGILHDGHLDNDATLPVLGKIAVSYAQAGADIVAPSGMMDGMVQSIRQHLDHHKFVQTGILSYAVKYASSLYGPFRDAAGCSISANDNRKHHQMNPSQRSEALLEAEADINEGADYLMIKPASLYLDIIRDLKNECRLPLVGYHVSGEYVMIKAASEKGAVDEREVLEETYTSMKRAGCTLIVSYAATKMGKWLSQ